MIPGGQNDFVTFLLNNFYRKKIRVIYSNYLPIFTVRMRISIGYMNVVFKQAVVNTNNFSIDFKNIN